MQCHLLQLPWYPLCQQGGMPRTARMVLCGGEGILSQRTAAQSFLKLVKPLWPSYEEYGVLNENWQAL